MKRSKNISANVVNMTVIFSVNNSCHKRHTQRPFPDASDISFSNKRRRSSSAVRGFTDSTAVASRCKVIRIISNVFLDLLHNDLNEDFY